MAAFKKDGRWPQGERRKPGERRTGPERRVSRPGGRGSQVPTKAERERRRRQRRAAERRDETGWQPLALDASALANPAPEQALLDAAAGARERAQAHYSGFKVGAALETPDGRVFTGCNIENASYGLTLCAERVALVKALSEGQLAFTRILVVADTEAPTPPCGPCRQLLWEYCGDIDVVLANLAGPTGRQRLSALLPMPFDRSLLKE